MAKTKRASTDRAQEFENHFSTIYGERWAGLRAALLSEPRKATLQNPFGLENYSLDEASVYPAKHLEAAAGDKIADFCASPGGKLLSSIFALRGEGEWTANDLSPTRAARLKAVLHDCLPPAILARVRVYSGDAGRWGRTYKDSFDRVLVDAPCSGERHLLASPQELTRWSLKGSKGLAVRQNALLCSALDCVRPGGRVVYSTCSISPVENDGVIERLHKSRPGVFQVRPVHEEMGEATAHGWILLPDRTGCGPIYFAVLEKLEGTD